MCRTTPRSLLWLLLAATAFLPSSACGPGSEDTSGGGGAGTGGEGGGGGDNPCPDGSIVGPAGACMAVGIQQCPERFIEEDGLCHPAMAKCADQPGTIPHFGDPEYTGDGCEPVGIPVELCPARFLEEDGLCHPSMAKCVDQPGTIPYFGDLEYTGDGCEPVGIQDCAPDFIGEDGSCHPSMDRCPEGTFAVPQAGCVPIDGAEGCGDGTWGNIQEEPDTVYVDGSVAASGDGSKTGPVKTIAEALTAVPEGGRIAIAAGVYDEPLHITRDGITVEGRCPSMVRVQGVAEAIGLPVIAFLDHVTDVVVRRLEIGGGGIGILAYHAVASSIEGVHVQGATTAGVAIVGSDADVSVSRSLIQSTLPQPSSKKNGSGLEVSGGARAEISTTAIVANRSYGVGVFQAFTRLMVENSLIEGTLPDASNQTYGTGAVVRQGAELALTATVVVDNHMVGLLASEPDTLLTMESSVVERTRPQQSDKGVGTGVFLQLNATAVIHRSALLDNRTAGLVAGAGSGTSAALKKSLIAGTLPQESAGALGGYGIEMGAGAAVTLERSALVANVSAGLFASGEAAKATGSDVVVEGTRINVELGKRAQGILVDHGAELSLIRAAIVGNHNTGVFVADKDTSMAVVASLIEGTHRPGLGGDTSLETSQSIWLADQAQGVIDSSAIVGNGGAGLVVQSDGTTTSLLSSLVKDTSSSDVEERIVFDAGIGAQVTGGQLTVRSSALVDNDNIGLVVTGGGSASITGLHVEGTRSGATGQFGYGISTRLARVELRDTCSLANRGGGIVLGDGSDVDITSTLVSGTLAQEGDGNWGVGVVADVALTARMSSLLVQDNLMAGMWFNATTAEVSDSWIDGVQTGKAILLSGTTLENVSDGVVVKGSDVTLRRVLIESCLRAGLLFNESTGLLEDVTATDGTYGLVLQGASQPSYAHEGNRFSGTAQDVLVGGDLPVPDTSLESPAVPPSN